MNSHYKILILCILGILPFAPLGGIPLANEEIGSAKHKFAQQFISVSLEELHLKNRFYPSNLSERAKWLSYCKYGWESCRSAIGTLFAPTDNRRVGLVCMDVKGLGSEVIESDQYVRQFSNKNFSFKIDHIRECTGDRVDERTHTVSIVFSDCARNKCSVRSFVKRNFERCGTGWKTSHLTKYIDGFQFEVIDGPRERILGAGETKLIKESMAFGVRLGITSEMKSNKFVRVFLSRIQIDAFSGRI